MSRRRSPSDYQPGETVRHFEILGPLGSGGMGVVYLARDRKLERDVALKFLPADTTGTGEESKRFLREARVASALDHPNICTVHAIDESADGRVFIAMAAYDGETLRQRIARGRLGLDEWLDIALQIARGLDAAHSIDIVHRDIKPANVMITSGGLVKILDFGLSKITSPGDVASRVTQVGTILGTLGYIPPEQVRGEPVGPASDIWSLGAVLYEMATGKLPFDATAEVSSLYSILHDEPEPPSHIVPQMPKRQEAIILRALEKDLQARYPSIDELADDLRELIRDEVSHPRLESPDALARWDPGELNRGSGGSTRPAHELTETMIDAKARRGLGSADANGGREDVPGGESGPTVRLRPDVEGSDAATHGQRVGVAGEHGGHPEASEASERDSGRRLGGRWSWFAGLVALALVIWLGSRWVDGSGDPGPRRAETRATLDEAREHLRQLDGAAAVELLAPAAIGRAVAPQVHLALSEAYALLGSESNALEQADAAIAAAEGLDAEIQALYQAQRANLRGHYVDAQEHLERYWAYRDVSGTWGDGLRLDRGLVLVRLRARNGRHDRAFELLTDLHRSAPGDVRLPLLEAVIAPDASDRLAAARQVIGSLRPTDGSHLEAQARLLEGRALRRLGEPASATAALESAFEIFESIGHDTGRADVSTVLGNLAWDRSDLPAARAFYERAAQLYGAAGNSRRRARLLTNKVLVLRELGDLEAAIAISRQALELQRTLGDRVGQVFTLTNLAGPLQLAGRVPEAIEVIEEAMTLVQTIDDVDARTLVLEAAGELHTLVGQLQRAGGEFETMRDLAEQAGDFLTFAQAETRLGRVRFLEGDLDAARRHYETALDRLAVAGAPLQSSLVLDALGQTFLWIGDLESCRQVLEEARRHEQRADVYGRASLRLSFAELLLFEGRTAEAAEAARQALDEISPERQVFQAIRGHEVLARVLLADAALDEADVAVGRARELIGDLDVPTHGIPTLHTAARIAVADGRLEAARTLLQDALAEATIHGYRVFGLKARALLGQVEMATGRLGTGRARLEAVLAEAEALKLGRIANQARESLAQDPGAP